MLLLAMKRFDDIHSRQIINIHARDHYFYMDGEAGYLGLAFHMYARQP
jgi:hypothetical protein